VKDIINLPDFCVAVFPSTSQALKAEKVLRAAGAEFIMMPTPREISTSCGLAVKFSPDNTEEYCKHLTENQVQVEGIFRICREGKKTAVVKIYPSG